jgi:hypothetical protein
MKTFKITKNGKDLKTGLTKDEAIDKLFPLVEDFSNGYIYDNEEETIHNEVDGIVIAKKGDECVEAGDNRFEIEEEIVG